MKIYPVPVDLSGLVLATGLREALRGRIGRRLAPKPLSKFSSADRLNVSHPPRDRNSRDPGLSRTRGPILKRSPRAPNSTVCRGTLL